MEEQSKGARQEVFREYDAALTRARLYLASTADSIWMHPRYWDLRSLASDPYALAACWWQEFKDRQELSLLLYDFDQPRESLSYDEFKAAVDRGFRKALQRVRAGNRLGRGGDFTPANSSP